VRRNRKRARADELGQPAIKRKTPPCPLLGLPPALLAHITGMIDPDDELAVSFVCREMRDAVVVSAVMLRGEERGRKMRTRLYCASRTMALLQWAVACGAPLSPSLAHEAAWQWEGCLEKLRWLRTIGCPWDERVLEAFASKGELEHMQWAREHGCPWGKGICERASGSGLAGHGRSIEVLKWLRANGCEYTGWEMVEPFETGCLDVLQWLRADGCPWEPGRRLGSFGLMRAAAHGQLAALVWARAEGCPWDPHTCNAAAKNGHLDVLQRAHANGCPWDQDMYKAASDRYDEVDDDSILRLCVSHGCPQAPVEGVL
jgi:hypothetical protein